MGRNLFYSKSSAYKKLFEIIPWVSALFKTFDLYRLSRKGVLDLRWLFSTEVSFLTCWIWVWSFAVEQSQIITVVQIQVSVVGVCRQEEGRKHTNTASQHVYTLCILVGTFYFIIPASINLMSSWYYCLKLTVPVVADWDHLTNSSVTEVVEVGLHKLREHFKIVSIWEETEKKKVQNQRINHSDSLICHFLLQCLSKTSK